MLTAERVGEYEKIWAARGYPEGIPDEVPESIMQLGIAPSWKAVAIAILKNDLQLKALGFSGKKSEWYGAFKRIELGISCEQDKQLRLF